MKLEKDVKLHQKWDWQSRLNNWMKYQFYHYQKLELLEKKIKQAQQELKSAQIKLRETETAEFK